MKPAPANELETALRDLERTFAIKRPPNHHHARAVLIALGNLLLTGEDRVADAAVERLQGLTGPRSGEWRAAVEDELRLACSEYIQSVDPRYLDHPRYDFEYTIRARHKLEARLRAAERLDLPVGEELLDAIVRADASLEPHLRRRSGKARWD